MTALHVFEYVLLLLAAILASNVINRFLPFLSAPILQIALGVGIALIPDAFHLELEPDLFFVLFIAPLVFNAGRELDKKTFWSVKNQIVNLAFIFVFASVIAVGYFVHVLIPAIPLAAAFVLVASLGPTDDVAVDSVAKRLKIPPKIMNILSGESLLNDVSGIICFQFALAAAVTGSFSLASVGGRFLLLGLGGVAVGLFFTALKAVLVRFLRSLGMENVTFHILIELLTPFLIYMLAEACGVSGVLAVFTAGIAHSLGGKNLNPETADLNMASKNIWSVLTFTLDGLVFVILGTQLPDIWKTLVSGSYSLSVLGIICAILFITLVLTAIRFLWIFCTMRKKSYAEAAYPMGKIKASILMTLSGARGAVTLASILSIPILLSNGVSFPERDLMILISTGVILCTLIMTNFILPILVEKKADHSSTEEEKKAYIEILQNVARELSSQLDDENRQAAEYVIMSYRRRITDLQQRQDIHAIEYKEERKLQLMAFEWAKENTLTLLDQGEIDNEVANHFLKMADGQIAAISNSKQGGMPSPAQFLHVFAHVFKFDRKKASPELKKQFIFLRESNVAYVTDRLKELRSDEENDCLEKLISDYERFLPMDEREGGKRNNITEPDEKSIEKAAALGFQLERNRIQTMYENGRISRELSNKLRNNISLLEIEMKQNDLV